jgi:hypothetical protein
VRSLRGLQPKLTGRDHLIEELRRTLEVIASNRAVPRASLHGRQNRLGVPPEIYPDCLTTCARHALGVAFHLILIEPIFNPARLPEDATRQAMEIT